MEWSFVVRLADVSARNVVCSQRTSHAMPFFRLDFDGKVLQSELSTAVGDPSWSHKASFEYRLVEPTTQDAIASLCQRNATMSVLYAEAGSGKEVLAGSAPVDLFSLAAGSPKIELDIADDTGRTTGHVSFTLTMAQQSVVSVQLDGVDVRGLPTPVPAKLSYYFLSDPSNEVEGTTVSASQDPHWDAPAVPKLLVKTTLKQVYEDTLRVCVRDASAGNVVMGVVDLPMEEMIVSNTNHSTKFKRNAYADPAYKHNFTALATGLVRFEDLPIFAQLTTGGNVNNQVHGKPLLDTCPVPPRLSRLPQRLPQMTTSGVSVLRQADNGLPQVIPSPRGAPMSPNHSTMHNTSYNPQPMAAPVAQPPFTGAASPYPVQQPNTSFVPLTPAPQAPVQQPMNISFAPPPQAMAPSYVGGDVPRATSPLADASNALMQQHNDAEHAILAQQRRIAALTEELTTRANRKERSTQEALMQLNSEEEAALQGLRDVTRRIDEVNLYKDESEAKFSETNKALRAELAGYAQEMDELAEVATHLTGLMRNVSEHAQTDEAARTRAAQEAEAARQRLMYDTRQVTEVEARLTSKSPMRQASFQDLPPEASTIRTAVSGMSNTGMGVPQPHRSPDRSTRAVAAAHSVSAYNAQREATSHVINQTVAQTGASTAGVRSVSPPRQRGGAAALPPPLPIPSTARPHSPNQSPRRQVPSGVMEEPTAFDVDRLTTAVENNDAVAVLNLIRAMPRAAHQVDSLLHIACAQTAPNFDIVSALVSLRPELVRGIDGATGNTPLHFACAARYPSVEVLDVLLSRGADVSTFNSDGLTPFHVALLNLSDDGHKLKRFLLFKGPVPINTLTAKGESPVHLVVSHDRYLEALRFLVNNGATTSLNAMVLDGYNVARAMTPMQKAEMYGRASDEIRRYLGQCEPRW